MDFSIANIIALLTLTFLEIVLGIDNMIFITITAGNLPEKIQKKARNIGFVLAMLLRILLLFTISILLKSDKPFYTIDLDWLHYAINVQSIILLLGGIFLLYKSASEIYKKVELKDELKQNKKMRTGLGAAIFQITLINIVFSFDSILTAIGLTKVLWIMVVSVCISVIIMMVFAGKVADFIKKHPSFQILGLAFLLLVGFMLAIEALHIGHFSIFDSPVGSIPKGYIYFAIFFAFGVELLHLKSRKN